MKRIPGFGPITWKLRAGWGRLGSQQGAGLGGMFCARCRMEISRRQVALPVKNLETDPGGLEIHHMIELRLGALKGYWRMQGLGAEKSLAES